MTKNTRILYVLSVAFTVMLALSLFLFPGNRLVSCIACTMTGAVAVYFLKKRAIYSINKREVLIIVSVIACLYVLAYYLTGIHYGFVSANNFTFDYFLSFVLPAGIIIVSSEIIRVKILAQENKIATVLCFVALVLAEITIYMTTVGFSTFYRFIDLTGKVILPAVTSNLLYHYLAKRYSFVPNIVYRLIITLYLFIIPYDVRISDAILAFAKFLIPLLVLLFIRFLYENKRYYTPKKSHKFRYVIYVILAIVCIAYIMLVSCQFRFGALVVGSESMAGEINKGDVVIYERYDGRELEKNNVIVFESDGTKVIHRIVRIEYVDGENRYYTKGDANDNFDAGYRTNSTIVGIVHLKVPYLGYPTLWIQDAF